MGSHEIQSPAAMPPAPLRTSESPVTPKLVLSSKSYQIGNDLHGARDAVLRELGPFIPQISFEDFLAHLAPPLHDTIDFDRIKKLLSSGSNPALVSGRWWKFPKKKRDDKSKEDQVFEPMPEIFTKVVKTIDQYWGRKHKPTVDFFQNPNLAPTSNDIPNSTRPDGYFVLKNRNIVMSEDNKTEKIRWADIALSFEYKRADGPNDLADDIRKCIWSLQHIMRDDPRRRASFAMTIEKTTTRLWFCCRSSVIVSDPFDFIEDPIKFVKFIAAFAFAGERWFGFDTTIEPAPEKKFVFPVHTTEAQNPRRFKTKRMISSYGAEPLRGRGTRVFEVVEIDGNNNSIGSPVVLKDIWIDSDRRQEGDILASLLDAADVKDKNLVKEHFLTTICHGDVQIDANTVDNTKSALMRGLDISSTHNSWFEVPLEIHGEVRQGTGSEMIREGACAQTLHPRQQYEHKTHYRIIFKELCTPIYQINTLHTVLEILKDIVNALREMRNKGWVHRDVSTGNILSYNGHGKLADLEYAKEMSDSTSHNMRTGTMDFMAIEVAAQTFLFRPSGQKLGPIKSRARKKKAGNKAPFVHNHLHDLESLWWVAVWIVFFNQFSQRTVSPDHPSTTLQDAKSQIQKARKIFPLALDSATRHITFQTPEKFLEMCEGLPSNKGDICDTLDQLRQYLIENYEGIEANLPELVDPSSSDNEIYDTFIEGFSELQTQYSDFVLEFIPEIQKGLLGGENSKRSRSEKTDPSGATKAKKK